VAGFDFDAAVRWARFDPRRTLARRGRKPTMGVHDNGGVAPLRG
jgi:hypothetical protein